MSIKLTLQQLGYESAHLDEVVHDAASQLASNANNDGMSSQVDFLITTCGWTEDQILSELGEGNSADES